jgi:hypothetical protein
MSRDSIAEFLSQALPVFGEYVMTYIWTAVFVIGTAGIIIYASMYLEALVTYPRSRQFRSLRRITHAAQRQYFIGKLLYRLRLAIWLGGGFYSGSSFRSHQFSSLLELSKMGLRLITLPFRWTFLNLLIWSITLTVLQPAWLNPSQLTDFIALAWSTDWGKLLPWVGLILVFTLYRRLLRARTRLHYREQQSEKALSLSIDLGRSLAEINYQAEQNVETFYEGMKRHLPEVWCREITGYNVWQFDGKRVSLDLKPSPLFPLESDPYERYQGAQDTDLEKLRATLFSLRELDLWGYYTRLWPQLGFETMMLHLEYEKIDLFFMGILDVRVVKELVKLDIQHHSTRLAQLVDNVKHDLVDIERFGRIPNSHQTTPRSDTTEIQALADALTAEVSRFENRARKLLARCLVGSLCARQIANVTLNYAKYSGTERFLMWPLGK